MPDPSLALRPVSIRASELARLRSIEKAAEDRLKVIERLTAEVNRLRPIEDEAARRLAIINELNAEISRLRAFDLAEQQAQREL